MSIFRKIAGTISQTFKVGLSGFLLKNSSGVAEVRVSDDSGYGIIRGATPVASNDLATKNYVDTTGTNIVVTSATATLSLFKRAVNPVRNSNTSITIDITDNINGIAIPGAVCRYSEDATNWSYGIITAVTVNIASIDITLNGVALTTSNDAYFEIGTPSLLQDKAVFIGGALTVGDDKNKTVNKQEMYWNNVQAFIPKIFVQADTAPTGADIIAAVAVGSVGDDVATITIPAGSTARAETTDNISSTNYVVNYGDKIFFNINQVGSGVAGSDLLYTVLFITNNFSYNVFTPIFPPDLPYGWIQGGISQISGTVSNVIELLSLAATTGNASDRGDLTIARQFSGSGFGDTYTNTAGGATDSAGSTQSNVIDVFDNASALGDASDRGDLFQARNSIAYVTGTVYSYMLGGSTTNAAGGSVTTIDSFDITVNTGNASDTGDLLSAKRKMTGVYDTAAGFAGGGESTAGTAQTVIERIVTLSQTESTLDSGDLIATGRNGMGASWIDGQQGYFAGVTSGAATNVIQSIDTSLTLVGTATDRADLSVSRFLGAGVSSETHGNFCGGQTAVGGTGNPVNVIDIIEFTAGVMANATDRGDLVSSGFGQAGAP